MNGVHCAISCRGLFWWRPKWKFNRPKCKSRY